VQICRCANDLKIYAKRSFVKSLMIYWGLCSEPLGKLEKDCAGFDLKIQEYAYE
jgi:hypothetical protein